MRISILHLITGRLAVATYFAAVLLPVLLIGYDGPWFGPGDISIRGKASFPSTFSPGFYSAFDLWFADHLGLRYPLIYAGTSFHIGALRRPVDRRVIFGRDGWMFWTDDRDVSPAAMADTRGKLRFKPGEIKRIDAQLRSIHEQLMACDIPSAVLVAPNKQNIYGEFLTNMAAGVPSSRFDVLLSALGPVASEMIIDPRPIMREAKLAHAPMRLYNKTDTHWNDLGAYYGYVAVMQKVAPMLPGHPEVKPLDEYQLLAARYRGGDMAARVLFSPWRFDDEDVSLSPKGPLSAQRETQIDEVHFVSRNPSATGRLVIFGDSFAERMVQFFTPHFNEVHRYLGGTFDGSIIAIHRPQFVLLEVTERYLDELLKPPVGLACRM
jgi:alginate O-acetyltransferase complex protein AlgJ